MTDDNIQPTVDDNIYSAKHEKMSNDLQYQLSVQRRSIGMTKLFNIRGTKIDNLRRLGVQPHLQILDISNTLIKSFEGAPGQPWLSKVIADGSSLESLAGLSAHPHLRDISFKETPLALKPYVRIACIIVIGPQLSIINKKPVKKDERIEAAKYPIIAKNLLEAGWQLELNIPSAQDPEYKKYFLELAQEYNLIEDIKKKLTEKNKLYEYRHYYKPPSVLIPQTNDNEEQLSSSSPRQSPRQSPTKDKNKDDEEEEENLESQHSAFVNEEDASALLQLQRDAQLEEDLAELLATLNIRVKKGENRQDEILGSINGLIEMVKIFDTCQEDITGFQDEVEDENEDLAQNFV